MDKAVILGVFNFVSFHVCKTLLNKGIEVDGVSIGDLEHSVFQAEKKLEVGRNANFTEYSLEKLASEKRNAKTNETLILSIYDFYMLHHDHVLVDEHVRKVIYDYTEKSKCKLDTVVILPVQLMMATKELALLQFLAQLKQNANPIQEIYLPTIYGPWQPPTFLFQQAIMSAIQPFELPDSSREWPEDALYVEDAVESIIDIIESGNPGEYLLESGKENYWQRCSDFLKIASSQIRQGNSPLKISRDIVRTPAKKVTSLVESFANQVNHTKLLYTK